MNTLQNYDSNESAPTPIEPTAQNNTQTVQNQAEAPSHPDDWRDAFLQRVLQKQGGSREYLFYLLESVEQLHNNHQWIIYALNKALSLWLTSEHFSAKLDRFDVTKLVNHTSELIRLAEQFECFDIESDYIRIKEGDEVDE